MPRIIGWQAESVAAAHSHRAKTQSDHVAAILEDASKRRRDEHPVRDAAERAERRGVEDAVFHHRPRAIGPKRVLVPPDTVRADFLDVYEAATRFPHSDARAPADRRRPDAHAIFHPRAFGDRLRRA